MIRGGDNNDRKEHRPMNNSGDIVTEDPYDIVSMPRNICTPADHNNKKNCAKNPWCLYGLGEHKEGIWKSPSVVIEQILGPDPNKLLRLPVSSNSPVYLSPPVGLRNLGATCYLNVLFQSLFHNLLVRDCVFNIKTEYGSSIELRMIIKELQNAFAHMLLDNHAVYDLSAFTDLLSLKTSIQQDPQEFNKLFISKLDDSKVKYVDETYSDFRKLHSGSIRYLTQCLRCSKERSLDSVIHELDLNIEDHDSIEYAIRDFTSPERLENENQYECSNCGCKRDALRRCEIVQLPTVLSLHLLRYTYDRKTLERKKLTKDVHFSKFLHIHDETYILVSVLYHKGQSSYSGHFVCDCLDWEDDKWWRFDDDKVTVSHNPATAELCCVDSKVDNASNDSENYWNQREQPDNLHMNEMNSLATGKSSSSKLHSAKLSVQINPLKDAYMISYVLKSEFDKAIMKKRCMPSSELSNAISLKRGKFTERINWYNSRCMKLKDHFLRRKNEYNEIKSSMPPNAINDKLTEFYVVPTFWLKQWIVGDPVTFAQSSSDFTTRNGNTNVETLDRDKADEPLKEDNDSRMISCEHSSGVSISKLCETKVLSRAAYEHIRSSLLADQLEHHFNQTTYRCEHCFKIFLRERQELNNEMIACEKMVKCVDNNIHANNNGEGRFWISKQFLHKLRTHSNKLQKRINNQLNSDQTADQKVYDNVGRISGLKVASHIDKFVNSCLLCTHGSPIHQFTKRALLFSPVTWNTISHYFPEARAIYWNQESCIQCVKDSEYDKQAISQQKAKRNEQLEVKQLNQLYRRRKIFPAVIGNDESLFRFPSLKKDGMDCFFVVDGMWMAQWRKYLADVRCPPPPLLTNSALKCEHDKALICDPILMIASGVDTGTFNKEVSIFTLSDEPISCSCEESDEPVRQKCIDSSTVERMPPAELVTQQEWELLLEFNSLRNDIESKTEGTHSVICYPIVLQYKLHPEESEDSTGWKWYPEICEKCQNYYHNRERNAQILFENADLNVILLKSEADLPNSSHDNIVCRLSQRPTRSTRSKGTKASIKASNHDTVSLIKLKLYEAFTRVDLPPARQKIYDEKGMQLASTTKTLADYGITSNAKLYVVAMDENHSVDDGGFADCFNSHWSSSGEQGFLGTALSTRKTRRESNTSTEGQIKKSKNRVISLIDDSIEDSNILCPEIVGTSNMLNNEEQYQKDMLLAMQLSQEELSKKS